MVEDGFLSNHHKNSTSTSLGSRMNCTNSSASTSVTNKSPVGIRKNFHLSSSSSPITVTTTSDGRVERRLETCSYQETEMVRFLTECLLKWSYSKESIKLVLVKANFFQKGCFYIEGFHFYKVNIHFFCIFLDFFFFKTFLFKLKLF